MVHLVGIRWKSYSFITTHSIDHHFHVLLLPSPFPYILHRALIKVLILSQLASLTSTYHMSLASHAGFVQSFPTSQPKRFFGNASQIFSNSVQNPHDASPSFPRSHSNGRLSFCLMHAFATIGFFSIIIIYLFWANWDFNPRQKFCSSSLLLHFLKLLLASDKHIRRQGKLN